MISSSRMLVLVCSLFLAGITNATEVIKTTGSGTAVKDGNLTILNLHGSWNDMGKQYGELMMSQLSDMDQEFYSRYYEFKIGGISFWVGRLTNNFFYYVMESMLDRREKEFLKGASITSGIPYQRLVILDLLPYLFTLNEASNGEHCSFISVNGSLSITEHVLIGRNMDYDTQTKEILKYVTMVIYHPIDGSNTVATFGFLGFIPGHTIITKNGLFLESNDGSYSSPVNTIGMVANLLRGKLDVLHRDFYVSLDAHSIDDAVNQLANDRKLSKNLSSSFSGIADKEQVFRLENPAGGGFTAQPKMMALTGQTKEYNFFTNLYTQPFSTAVLTTFNCTDKTNDSPSYACARYHNIEQYLQKQSKVDLQSIKDFMLTPLDNGGVYQTGNSINYPVGEISLQSIVCDMSSLVCFYRDFDFNPNEWKEIQLNELFNN